MHIAVFPPGGRRAGGAAFGGVLRHGLFRLLVAALLVVGAFARSTAAAPLTLVPVAADRTHAGFADLAVDADGTLHALWQDKSAAGDQFELLYAASFDGVNWTEPLSLTRPEAEQAGAVGLELDGRGRLYAFWKVPSTGIWAPGIDAMTLLGASGGPLYYRVLESGVWSAPVAVGRGDHAYGWYTAVDRAGRVQVVWSESDGAFGSPMAWLETANVIRAAVLDGTQLVQREILRDENKGFHGLDGFVDDAGNPVFVALANGQAHLWNGNILWPVLQDVSGGGLLDAAWLLRGPDGGAHLIYHDPASGAVAHWPVGESSQSWIVPQKTGGDIVSFRATEAEDGFLLTVVTSGGGAGGADAEVLRYRDGRWEAPVNVTGNGSRERAAGVMGTETAVYHQAIWSALYGLARPGRAGAVNVLLVNSRVEVVRGDMGILGGSAALARPQVYFTRLGQPLQDSGRVPARTALTDQQDRPPPPPGPVAGLVLPAGTYACQENSAYVGAIPNNRYVAVLEGGQYVSADGMRGTFTGDGAVTWTSGPFADGSARAEAGVGEMGRPMLTVATGDRIEFCELQ